VLTGFIIFVVTLGIGLVAAVRQRRLAYEPDDRPSDLALLGAIARSPLFLLTVAVFPVSMLVADSSGTAAAVLASVGMLAAGAVGTRAVLRSTGIERQHLLVATSIAFIAMAATCGVWSMFEVFADAPLLSMRVPWTVGIVVLVSSVAIQRRRAA